MQYLINNEDTNSKKKKFDAIINFLIWNHNSYFLGIVNPFHKYN